MASPEQVPGDVIVIDSSSDEDTASAGRKRPRTESASESGDTSSSGSSRGPKKAKLSSAGRASRSQGSEEGEVEETAEGQAAGAERAANPGSAKAGKPKQASRSKQLAGAFASQSSAECLSGVVMAVDPPLWSSGPLSFKLPAFTAKREGSWPARFKDWVHVFYQGNLGHSATISPVLVVTSYIQYLDSYSGLKPGKRKSGKQAANQALESGTLAKQLEMLRAAGAVAATPHTNGTARQASSSAADAKSKPEHESSELGDCAAGEDQGSAADGEQLAQQRKYFPSAADPSNVCLSCAREGHVAAGCPYSACRFCGGQGHWDFCCPTKERCTKCSGADHDAAACVEKPKPRTDEGLACVFCGAAEHLEDECTDVWRSFHPDADTIRLVSHLPVSCAICGARDHFLSDCALREHAANPTWSLANRDRYLDPACGNACIEAVADPRAGAKSTRASGAKIRGRAAQNTNVHYSESDDSDMEFLGNRIVKPPGPAGQIRMSSNINAKRHIPAPAEAQPPLPPGPPPALPGSGQASTERRAGLRQRPPGASLPAKPPPPAQGFHNVPPPPPVPSGPRAHGESKSKNGRGGHGFRGGRGGKDKIRGRGRGRGRGK
ncbi:hypothetical protein CDD83_69 [Cordyceps sp. RAO-2017]|nr:hypothetical protein CDD83_69 [Cordyceps sp. RAO-2017]